MPSRSASPPPVNPHGDENYIVFSCQVQADDVDVNGIGVANDALTGGSITGPYVYGWRRKAAPPPRAPPAPRLRPGR